MCTRARVCVCVCTRGLLHGEYYYSGDRWKFAFDGIYRRRILECGIRLIIGVNVSFFNDDTCS